MLAQLHWNSLHLLPWVAVLAAALVVAVVWLYPAQLRNAPQPWRWVLPGLRLAGLLVLSAALLQPVAQRLRRADELGAVLVLVDRSLSMSVADAQRTPAERVALAAGLGRLPPGVRPEDTAAITRSLERLRELVSDVVSAGNDVETAEAFGRGVDAARARLAAARGAFGDLANALASRAEALPPDAVDARTRLTTLRDIPFGPRRDAWSADARAKVADATRAVGLVQAEADRRLYESNEQVRIVCDELAGSSRWSLVQEALFRPGSGLATRVGSAMPLVPYTFADAAAPGQPEGSPDGVASDVTGAVARVLADAHGRPVRAVVVFSDGRQVAAGGRGVESSADARAPSASAATSADVPVFTVDVAPTERPLDVAIMPEPAIPASAFAGETVTIRATVRATGLPAAATAPAAVNVELETDGEVVRSRQVTLNAGGSPTPVEFTLIAGAGGPQHVTLRASPLPGEVTRQNNVVDRWMKVFPERMKVAMFTATPGWDFQLLHRTLARTPWVSVDAAVLNPESPRLPLAPDEIQRHDVIVLSDVPSTALDDVQWDAVDRLVRERGGVLLLVAGPDHLPSSYTPETFVPSALLPYDVASVTPSWRTWPGPQPAFRFAPAPDLTAEQVDALRLGPGAGSLRQWDALGGTFRIIPVPEINRRREARALLVEADSRLPLLTETMPGNGRVLYLGTNETWRWRAREGGRDFERFWLQLIRYAAGEPYAAQSTNLALDADRLVVAPGEAVNVRVRALRGVPEQFRLDVLHEGRIVHQDGVTPAAGVRGGGGRFVATLHGLDAGEYTVRLIDTADDIPDTPPLEVPLRVARSTEAEMADVSGDDALLARIAESSGGQFLPLERLPDLPRLLAATGDGRSRFSQWRLWDSPLLFLFVVACFGAEWAVRKRLGLA
jgi:hypothetical protein